MLKTSKRKYRFTAHVLNGAAPISPPLDKFITTNATSATLHLGAWSTGGCPVTRFAVQYRLKFHPAWLPLADALSPRRRHYVLADLVPGRQYQVQVVAHSEAGATQADFEFPTPALSAAGGPHPRKLYLDDAVILSEFSQKQGTLKDTLSRSSYYASPAQKPVPVASKNDTCERDDQTDASNEYKKLKYDFKRLQTSTMNGGAAGNVVEQIAIAVASTSSTRRENVFRKGAVVPHARIVMLWLSFLILMHKKYFKSDVNPLKLATALISAE
ncbi:hypothetical protein V5799_015069 [Amblyomma americanum]|uniref:Fibronectin type-III domain-containing protein n=1 Tax=Amblyomma americanum TaxID=6943 RepID=A0AAQ4E176_AMBAM